MEKLLARLQGRNAALLVLGLGSTVVAVLMLGVIGFFSIDSSKDSTVEAGPAFGGEETSTTLAGPESTVPGAPGAPTTVATLPGGKPATTATTKPSQTIAGKKFIDDVTPPGEAPLPEGGNATGVSSTTILYGVHAPLTFNRTPVALAGPVARGIEAYVEFLNTNGGINGRKIDERIVDDEFTPRGAQKAATTLITDMKVFFVAGTLGVDQISVVAAEANKAKVPYFAGGGHEPMFKQMKLHQILSSYDTHVLQLADFLGKDPALKGKVIGVMSSDTPQIQPVVGVFSKALEKYGMSVKVNKPVQKPEDQAPAGYQGVILDFKNKGVQVVIPMTDPINTSGLVRECGVKAANSCPWTYSFSNFAHEGETALTLFGDEWGVKKVRGLAGACYPNAPVAQTDNPAKCSQMKAAREQFNAVKKDSAAWTKQQNDGWGTSVGYNSAAGYQWLFFKKAMTDQGTVVTRERFLAAINRYNGYADLITGPITYKGSTNYAHGATKMAVFEAQTSNKYKMLTDGMVDGF